MGIEGECGIGVGFLRIDMAIYKNEEWEDVARRSV